MKQKIILFTIILAINQCAAIKFPFISCTDKTFVCLGGNAPAMAPELSVWSNLKELSTIPNIITIKTARSGTTCVLSKNPQLVCTTKWTGSTSYELEDTGFFNQIYVKSPNGTYSLEREPIDPTAYNALKSAYVQAGTALLRRAIPGQLTKLLSTGYGYMQEQKNPRKTAQHINDLVHQFGYSWDGIRVQVINPEKIWYAHALGVNPDEWVMPEGGYQAFNDFFTHRIKNGSRPVTSTALSDVVSPADSKVTVLENVSAAITLFNVKQEDFTLEKFLGDSDLAKKFDGATMVIFRLSPYNYHRFNFPVDAIPLPSKFIKTTGLESVDPVTYKTGIDPLIINKRELIPLETPYGQILVVVVGAFNVGTIVDTYKPCILQTKSNELGYFSYGGSTLVVVFKPGAITVNPEILTHSNAGFETAIKMGEKIAVFTDKYFDSAWDNTKIMSTCTHG